MASVPIPQIKQVIISPPHLKKDAKEDRTFIHIDLVDELGQRRPCTFPLPVARDLLRQLSNLLSEGTAQK